MLFLLREQMSIQLLTERFAIKSQIGFICHVSAYVAITHPSTLAVVTGVKP